MASKPKTTDKAKDEKRLVTPPFVASYPHFFVPRRANPDEPNSKLQYSCSAIWTPAKFTPKDKELWNAILKELDRVSRDAFKTAWKDLDASVYKKGLRNGKAKEGMAGYGEGTRFANLTTKHKPGVVDQNRQDISPEIGNEELIYPGCICRATVSVYAYGTKPGSKGKGVAIGLRNIQLVGNGPRLDNRVAAKDDFDDDIEADWLDKDDDLEDASDDFEAGGETEDDED